jgi:OPA family glycerol-3-phosphate transporter-like MFS transporter 3
MTTAWRNAQTSILDAPGTLFWNGTLMTVVGFFIGGPANLISGAISTDLGRSPTIAGNAKALSTVTGVVDGTGSVGAALGQLLVRTVEQSYTHYSLHSI